MKKKNILNLIKYFVENNDMAFREEAYSIARYFDKTGDHQLAEYIMSLLSNANTFMPQTTLDDMIFFRKLDVSNSSLFLPSQIKKDIIGIINAIGHNLGVNKFLFEGAPGTGKTESVKQLARILEKELLSVDFDSIIDSKLGQTSKNIVQVFDEIRNFPNPSKVIILFDEIDALALDRVNNNDLREMGRVTSSLLKELDRLSDDIVLVATTNLYQAFDKAIIRRFDKVINFNRYTREDLLEVAEGILDNALKKFKFAGSNKRLFNKITNLMDKIPYPGDLENLIKTSLAFSLPNNEFDYLRNLLLAALSKDEFPTLDELNNLGFTVREIEILTGVSKSQVSRELKE
jgi:Cdc6-like AAA superfamily ATPase